MKEEFQRADKLFTTFSRFYTKIIAFLLGMDENSATEDSPNTIPKRRGKYCVAFDCNNSYYGVDGLRTNYHFFTFPKSVQQRNRWCNLIKRRHGKDGFLVKSSTVVCSDHFTPGDIVKKLSGRWELKKGKYFLFTFLISLQARCALIRLMYPFKITKESC